MPMTLSDLPDELLALAALSLNDPEADALNGCRLVTCSKKLCKTLTSNATFMQDLRAARTMLVAQLEHLLEKSNKEYPFDPCMYKTTQVALSPPGLHIKNARTNVCVITSRILRATTSLTLLKCSHNNIGDAGAKALAGALVVNTSLKELVIWTNSVGNDGAKALSTSICVNDAIHTLDLRINRIGASGAAELASLVASSRSLTSLNLSRNKIGSEGATAIAGAVSSGSSLLRHLYLWSNEIGDIGATAFGAVSRGMLKTLHLGGNLIGDQGAKALAAGMLKNLCFFKELNLQHNDIGNDGANAILSTRLSALSLRGNKLTGEAVAGHITTNDSLTSLDVSQNSLGTVGVNAIARAIDATASPALKSLEIPSAMSPDALEAIVAACLRKNIKCFVCERRIA